MSDLDEKLKGVVDGFIVDLAKQYETASPRMQQTLTDNPAAEEYWDGLVSQIKQAFTDDGWVDTNDVQFKLIYNSSPVLNPEWMVKHGIDYNSILDVSILPPLADYEAAKRASGLDDTQANN
jgi:hypothetical protein